MLFMLNYDNKRSITQYCGERNFQVEYCTFLCHCYCTSSFLKRGLRINPWVASLFSDIFSILKQWLRMILCPISGSQADIYDPDQSSMS